MEITPSGVLITFEFFDEAKEIGEAEVDEAIIDDGLRIIRRLWDAGLAHRDIKPANLLVRDGRVHLIDVFFAEVRPSPWRQAVDLANMMLVLAIGPAPEQVTGGPGCSSTTTRSPRPSPPPAASPCPPSCAG